jgi:AraC-like DNA-binding protein
MYSVQISIMRDLIYGAVSHGANLQALCDSMGIKPQLLIDAENHMEWEAASKFWENAVAMTGDAQLGLHMGQDMNFSAFGMLGFLAQSCRTVEESLQLSVKYTNTLSSIFKYSLELTDEYGYIIYEPLPAYESGYPESARQAVDVSVSSFIKRFNTISTRPIHPVRIELKHEQRDLAEYERILGAHITFGAGRNCIVLKRSDLQCPIISYDKSLFALFDGILSSKQQSFSEGQSLTERIHKMLLFDFKGQAPAVEIVASRLSLTVRTLQRKLAEEKSSYRDICNQLRRELSTEMIGSNMKKEQVATLLGYADASTLRRKYKSWTKEEAAV